MHVLERWTPHVETHVLPHRGVLAVLAVHRRYLHPVAPGSLPLLVLDVPDVRSGRSGRMWILRPVDTSGLQRRFDDVLTVRNVTHVLRIPVELLLLGRAVYDVIVVSGQIRRLAVQDALGGDLGDMALTVDWLLSAVLQFDWLSASRGPGQRVGVCVGRLAVHSARGNKWVCSDTRNT